MVSNIILAVLVVVAIVVSVAGISMNLMIPRAPLETITGQITGTAQVQVAPQVLITLPVSTVDFGSIYVGNVTNTSDFTPSPFLVQNDGSVDINITTNASQLWSGTGATGTSIYYRFQSAENETGSVPSTSDLVTTWTNIPVTENPIKFATRLDYTNSTDTLKGHIYLDVPSDEPAGDKSSTVTFIATQA